jgi:DNA-directed RNA polymerase subunit RPC12/RpoP
MCFVALLQDGIPLFTIYKQKNRTEQKRNEQKCKKNTREMTERIRCPKCKTRVFREARSEPWQTTTGQEGLIGYASASGSGSGSGSGMGDSFGCFYSCADGSAVNENSSAESGKGRRGLK